MVKVVHVCVFLCDTHTHISEQWLGGMTRMAGGVGAARHRSLKAQTELDSLTSFLKSGGKNG